MNDTSLLQLASIAPVKTLASRFEKYAEQERDRDELTRGLLDRIVQYETQINSMQLDLDAQTKSRIIYQQEARNLQEEKSRMEHKINRDAYIAVLIDGDGAKFLDNLLRNPVPGAVEAGRRLRQEVHDYLKDTSLGNEDLPIFVRVFANLNGLATSLSLSSVIESANDMHVFAEEFTNSRAEFDFINVGYGKANADSKMRKMIDHFSKNVQCKQIFFAGCHDKDYIHDLRGYIGESAEERIVLVETTPAEPGFQSFTYPIIRFDTVFRREPLDNERKRSVLPFTSRHPTRLTSNDAQRLTAENQSSSPPSTLSAALNHHPEALPTPIPSTGLDSTARSTAPATHQASTNIALSGNGGVSVRYPASYATASGTNDHTNVSIQAAKAKPPKVINHNANGRRLDSPIKRPMYGQAQSTYNEKMEIIKPRVFCNEHYLASGCKWGDNCDKHHGTNLSSEELVIQRYKARTSLCNAGPSCFNYSCPLSHHCPFDPCGRTSDCRFRKTRYGDLHLYKEDLIATTRWTEGDAFPTSVIAKSG